MIRGILFDFAQTLGNAANGFRLAEKEAQQRIHTQLGLSAREDFLTDYRRFRKQFHEKSLFSRIDMWNKLFIHYGKKPRPELLEEWEEIYWDRVEADMKLFPETESVLEKLSGKYYLAIITNAQRRRNTRILYLRELSRLEQFFRIILIAGEGGVPPKPAPEPFRLCLNKMNLAPSEAVFVGDDWDIDICGARKAEIQPIWLKHRLIERSWPAGDSTVPVIHNLEPLQDLEKIINA